MKERERVRRRIRRVPGRWKLLAGTSYEARAKPAMSGRT